MNIEEGNKIIAEFMNNKHSHYSHNVQDGIMYYNSSWDWLMPVVEKIESLYDDFHGHFAVYIGSNCCTIQGTKLDLISKHYAYFSNIYGTNKINATWEAIGIFIQWYNKQAKLTVPSAEK